ncbi:MAG: hypothetical protein KatS3mg057_2627 [Herpetosiphonaceae bacterium]|nr:MAG: hypothetical protein KatS3mg057_2627 [Herpetosiphonaceae bacterium]
MRRSIVLVSALWTLLVLASFLPQHSGAETNAVRLVSSRYRS